MEISVNELEMLARKLNTQETVKKDSREVDFFVKPIKALEQSLDAAMKENAELKEVIKSPVPCRDCTRVKVLECIIENGKTANKEQYDRICKLEADVQWYKERHKNKDFQKENERLHAENRRLEEENTNLQTERNMHLEERSMFTCKIDALKAYIIEHEGYLPEDLK